MFLIFDFYITALQHKIENKKVPEVFSRPSGRARHAVPPEFRAFALHLTESDNSLFCNGKTPAAFTRRKYAFESCGSGGIEHTILPAALSPSAARFEENAVCLSPSTLYAL